MIVDRYARVLFDLSDDWLEPLEALKEVFNANVMAYFSSPIVPVEKKKKLLVKHLQIDPKLLNFLQVLLKKKRFAYFPEIVEAYKKKVFAKQGILDGTLIIPTSVDEATKKNLADKWGMLLDKKISIKEKVDKSLIGGGILMLNNQRVDFSLRGKLENLKNAMRS